MSIIEIRPAQREGARVVLGLGAPTGQGKTVTAILLAYGLANYDASKVGFLDSENRRGSLNADILQILGKPTTQTPFLIGDLVAPFSPSRYSEAILEFQKAGVEVLVIDSITHEHEGPGGLIEIADGGPDHPTPNKYWNRAKAEHKKFMNALLQSDMHIIVCVRAREKAEPTVIEGKKGYADLGMQMITEKNVPFELTASLMLADEGKTQTNLKMPEALRPYLGRNTDYLTAADGKAVRDWVDGAKQQDPAVEKYRNRLLSVCVNGTAFITDVWTNKTPDPIRTALGTKFYDTLIASATAYDKAKEEGGTPEPETGKTPAANTSAPANAIAAAAAAGLAAKAAEPAKPDPVVQPAKAVAAQPTATVSTIRPAASVVVERKAAEAPKQELPLATPAAAERTAARKVGLVGLDEPMF